MRYIVILLPILLNLLLVLSIHHFIELILCLLDDLLELCINKLILLLQSMLYRLSRTSQIMYNHIYIHSLALDLRGKMNVFILKLT